MSRDDLDSIPSIVPSRDGVPAGTGRKRRRADQRSAAKTGAARRGAGWLASLMILCSLAVALGAAALAWQLQREVQASAPVMADYEQRIADLEARLADTDEGMTQNATLQAAKIRELDSEVRKLWDNVWKRSKERLSALEADSQRRGNTVAALDESVASLEADQAAVAEDLARLKSVSGDLSRLMASAKTNQAEVERVADSLNRIELELAKMSKRVEGNEEWVGSINAFRRQINGSIVELKESVRSLQGG